MSLERDAINEARESERQARDLLKRRAEEEGAIVDGEAERARAAADGAKVEQARPVRSSVSVYDTARSKLATDADDDGKDAGPAVAHDYLTPFLPTPIGVDGPPCSKDEAFTARDNCLKALKERLVERANIVQSRLDEENAALSKRQAAFQRNRDHMEPADEAEYERYCQEAMFRIQILEQRLDRHRPLAPEVRRDGRAAAQRPEAADALDGVGRGPRGGRVYARGAVKIESAGGPPRQNFSRLAAQRTGVLWTLRPLISCATNGPS